MTHEARLLTLNAGSSSLKAAVYPLRAGERPIAGAEIDRIGTAASRLRTTTGTDRSLPATDHAAALAAVLDWLAGDVDLAPIAAIAHRVVHGGDFTEPQPVTPELIAALRRLTAVDPNHLPQTIAAIEKVAGAFPEVPQIACFDTAFHRTLPRVARMYPLPPRFEAAGVRRYGFHGLSCEYIMSALRTIDPVAAARRTIIAHLGGGASMTAVMNGRSVETTMGFSPAGGLMMGTRSGDLDPGVLVYALRERHRTAEELNGLVNADSGLLGVSGSSADMRDLTSRRHEDPRAADAVALFCHLARKSLGALMAVLGGLDTLVFTGGIGEHSSVVRALVTAGLDDLGVSMDASRNDAHEAIVSTDRSRTVVRVMATNEDLVLARQARQVLGAGGGSA